MNAKLKKIVLMALLGLSLVAPSAPALAGHVDGPTEAFNRAHANSKVVYIEMFRGGEVARVFVRGDTDTDLDLYVYDASGELVAFDNDATDVCLAIWRPSRTGIYRIEVVNLGSVYNDFVIRTN